MIDHAFNLTRHITSASVREFTEHVDQVLTASPNQAPHSSVKLVTSVCSSTASCDEDCKHSLPVSIDISRESGFTSHPADRINVVVEDTLAFLEGTSESDNGSNEDEIIHGSSSADLSNVVADQTPVDGACLDSVLGTIRDDVRVMMSTLREQIVAQLTQDCARLETLNLRLAALEDSVG